MSKSSVGSTGVPADDALLAHYPVDDIQETTTCELHMKMKNISMKVADGFALPNAPEATIHGNPIPPGYARVGVDEVLSGYDSLELDFPGGQGEQTLGEAIRGLIVWRKECIVFPNSVPRPPTPPPSPPRQPTPTHLETEPSASTRYRSPPREPTPKWKRAPKKKPEPPAKKKLAYEMTEEENKWVVDAQVKAHFAPKPPPTPKEKIFEKVIPHFVDLAKPAMKKRRSNYERSISKSYYQQKNQQSSLTGSNKSRKTVPQLEEQEVQSIPPLKVSTDKAVTDADREMAREMGITVEQLLGIEEVPTMDPKELAWKYVPGNPLVRPEEVPLVPTQMYKLHEWYLREVNVGRESLMVKVKLEHYFHGKDLWIELPEVFQLFNQDALDKSLVSCYCL